LFDKKVFFHRSRKQVHTQTDEGWTQSALSVTQRTLRSLCELCDSLCSLWPISPGRFRSL